MEEYTRNVLEHKMCHILRHRPDKWGIILDEQGFCNVKNISNVLNITVDELIEVVNLSNKHRFEIVDDKVRALYGHSIKEKIIKEEIEPPCYLYHGTTKEAYKSIKTQGLKPMNRQYVHLSIDAETAEQVGKRRENNPYMLLINADKAYKDGYKFYKGNDSTILTDELPCEYIELINHIKYKGIFWIVDFDTLENNDSYFFFIETDEDGTIINYDQELTSKNEDNYNHKLTWNSLPKSLTHNREFNYYPRGRVEIKNEKRKLFLNPILMEDRVLNYIKEQFSLDDDVIIIADNSMHYQCKESNDISI